MLEKYCDILVIGTELPGLVTAAFLARRGLSVQILDTELHSEHPHAPDPVLFTNVHSKLLRSILGRLNVPEVQIQSFLHEEDRVQTLFPKARIDVHANPLLFFEEIARDWPEREDTLKDFFETQAKIRHQTDLNELFRNLLPVTWSERRQLKKFIQTHELNRKALEYNDLSSKHTELKAFLQGLFVLATEQIGNEPFAYQVAELFNPGDGEIFGVINGQRSLKRILIDRILHHDGGIRKKSVPQKLLYRGGIIEGAELRESRDAVLAKYVLWNAPLGSLADLLPTKWKFHSLAKSCRNAEKFAYHWFTARFELPADHVPEPMRHNAILVDNPDEALLETNFLYLQVSPTPKSTTAYIDANFLLPASALDQEPAFFAQYFKLIREKILKLMPFSETALTQVFPLEPDPAAQDTLFPMNENDFLVFRSAARRHGVSTPDAKTFADLFPIGFRTPVPNFFLSSPQLFSAFGIEAKLLLGLKITDLIWQETEKDKKHAMKAERRIA